MWQEILGHHEYLGVREEKSQMSKMHERQGATTSGDVLCRHREEELTNEGDTDERIADCGLRIADRGNVFQSAFRIPQLVGPCPKIFSK